MSTTINVTVGGNGLLDQSRQQMRANRFGKLERDQDATAQAEAAQQKASQLEQQLGRLPRQQRLTPEPAANRRLSQLSVGHTWVFEKYDTSYLTRSGIYLYSGFSWPSDSYVETYRSGPGITRQLISGDGTQGITFDLVSYIAPPAAASYWSGVQTGINAFGDTFYYATRAINKLAQQTYNSADFLFPVGNGALIYACVSNTTTYGGSFVGHIAAQPGMGPEDYSTYSIIGGESIVSETNYSYANRQIDVFYCGSSTVKRIGCPPLLSEFIDIMRTAPQSEALEERQTYGNNAWYWKHHSAGGQFAGSQYPNPPSDSSADFSWSQAVTPNAFNFLNAVTPLPPSLTLRTYTSSIPTVTEDYSRGGYQGWDVTEPDWPYWRPVYNAGTPLFYATYKGEESAKPMPKPSLTFTTPRTSPLTYEEYYGSEYLLTVLDWGAASYCYNACRAMGFSDADLTP